MCPRPPDHRGMPREEAPVDTRLVELQERPTPGTPVVGVLSLRDGTRLRTARWAADGSCERAGTVLIVHKDAGLLLAAPRSKISKIADLTKKRVGIVPGTAANV